MSICVWHCVCKEMYVVTSVYLVCEAHVIVAWNAVISYIHRMPCIVQCISSCLQNCVASLKILIMANDVTTSRSLCWLAWKPHDGKALAVPVETEVKIYKRLTWKPKCSLKDDYHQKVIFICITSFPYNIYI